MSERNVICKFGECIDICYFAEKFRTFDHARLLVVLARYKINSFHLMMAPAKEKSAIERLDKHANSLS